MKRFSELDKGSKTAAVIATVLIACGLLGMSHLVVDVLGRQWQMVWSILSFMSKIGPALQVIAGILVVWANNTGKLDMLATRSAGKQFARSVSDSRFAGICGGISRYYGFNSAIVRIVTLFLLLTFPAATLFAYVVLALTLPRS